MWVIWLTGGVLLVAAGTAAGLVPRWRAREHDRRVAWSAARAAIDSAQVSRDAAAHPVAEAERLMRQAELVAAAGGGADAARLAARYAERADRLWRAGRDG